MNEQEITRFWERVDKSGDCWTWKWSRSPQGYGRYYPTGRKLLSHRFAYEVTYGAIPDNLCVLHRCDNPACCNPDHLFLGTRTDNIADRQAKGRTRTGCLKGATNPGAKLTAEQVRTIRDRIASGETRTALAKEYGTSVSTMSHIALRKKYREVA